MKKLEFDESQVALLHEIKAPYEPNKNYMEDYSSDEDCPLSILVEYVKSCEIDYAQATNTELLKKAGDVALVVDILMAYEEYAHTSHMSNRAKEAA